MEIKVKKGDYVLLKKISDDVFNGNHPGGINAGYVKSGHLHEDVKIGERVRISDQTRLLTSSLVTEIINEYTFKTENSTYHIINGIANIT